MDEIYSGAASFGRVWTLISAWFTTILAVFVGLFGLYLLYRQFMMRSVEGIVLGGSREKSTYNPSSKQTVITYVTLVSWTVGDKKYSEDLESDTPYEHGDKVTVYYERSTPGEGTLMPMPKWSGFMVIGGALGMVIIAWLWVYATQRWKFLAAATGVSDVYRLVQ